MSNPNCVEDTSTLQRLQQLFTLATLEASSAMSGWTNSQINLTLDEVGELPLAEACLDLNLTDEQLTMVVLNLEGELGGSMVLTFTEEEGRLLAASLLQCAPNEGPEWNEMEVSALSETGNILGCAYIDAITRLINRRLVPSVPYFVQDFAASVLEQALVAQANGRDTVMVCRTGFHCQNDNLSWRVLFIPTVALRTAMENAMHTFPPSMKIPTNSAQ
jgi:chemotaxis protein CheC